MTFLLDLNLPYPPNKVVVENLIFVSFEVHLIDSTYCITELSVVAKTALNCIYLYVIVLILAVFASRYDDEHFHKDFFLFMPNKLMIISFDFR